MIQFKRLDHIQLCIPTGKESEARAFYTGILGLQEIPKPEVLLKNGGLWYQMNNIELHIGTEPNDCISKRHPAFEVKNISKARKHLLENGVRIKENTALSGIARFSFYDPFNNRIELLEKNHDSSSDAVQLYWKGFIEQQPEYKDFSVPEAYCFCSNKKDADTCAQLVINGIKTATCSALIEHQIEQDPLPEKGDLWMITNWEKQPVSIIKTTNVYQKQFKDIDEVWARKEGEGDFSLTYWREGHWNFFVELLKAYGMMPTADMLLVCEEFERIY